VAHPSEVASGKWHIEGHYPTQAKGRLEWGTQHLLPVHRDFEVVRTRQFSHPLPVPAAKAGCPIQAAFWLEWDTTALDQWCRSGSLNFSAGDLDFQLIAFVDFNRVCKVHPGLVLVLLYARG
jgi:hypothetical protein